MFNRNITVINGGGDKTPSVLEQPEIVKIRHRLTAKVFPSHVIYSYDSRDFLLESQIENPESWKKTIKQLSPESLTFISYLQELVQKTI